MTGYQSKKAAAQDKLAQPAQEPVADGLIRDYINALLANKPDLAAKSTKRMVDYVFATPPAAAQPAQEPVAVQKSGIANSPSDPEICNERSAQACGPVYCGDSGGYCNKCPKQKTIQTVKACKGMNCGCTDGRSHSLECLAELAAAIDTTPPQRPWVDLTDDDCKGMSAGDILVAMWVSRILKEKNT